MDLSRKEMWQLFAVVVVAALVSLLIQARRPLGENVGGNALALAVRNDRSSPADGPSTADLTLIVFTDYRCPACRAAYPAMTRAMVRDRKVRIVYKDWPVFGEASERAAAVAIASDFQDIYPLVHDRLMTGRADSDAALRAAVEGAGGNWRTLQRDLSANRARIDAAIERNTMQAFGLGLGGTPGYLIGPILIRGALTEAEFTRAFKQAREAS